MDKEQAVLRSCKDLKTASRKYIGYNYNLTQVGKREKQKQKDESPLNLKREKRK
jgi:hypothetical protein